MIFSEHVKQFCLKSARQLNALARISKCLSMKAKKQMFRSFILSNFTYCSIVWHFCGSVNNSKLEKIQERALRIEYDDYDSTYDDLLSRFGTDTVLLSRLKNIVIEVFKSLKPEDPFHTYPAYVREIFEKRNLTYFFRNPVRLVQKQTDSTNFGLRTFGYLGSNMWNDLPVSLKDFDFAEMTVKDFKSLLKNWPGPDPNICLTPLL